MKNPNAVALGSMGGKASAKKKTREQMIAQAKIMTEARKKKRLQEKYEAA